MFRAREKKNVFISMEIFVFWPCPGVEAAVIYINMRVLRLISDELAGSSNKSRLQKVETRKLQLAGIGEQVMISNSYNR